MDEPDPEDVGQRIRVRREEAGLSLNRLANEARVSKSYLWNLENDHVHRARPSGRTLYQIAEALGTTMSDLLGEELLVEIHVEEVPPSLVEFAERERLNDADVHMLAGVNFRGQQPQDVEGWSLVWHAIRASVRSSRVPPGRHSESTKAAQGQSRRTRSASRPPR